MAVNWTFLWVMSTEKGYTKGEGGKSTFVTWEGRTCEAG